MAIQSVGLDYLNPGTEVRIVTSLKNDVTGEVIACDGNQRMLLLKSHRSDQPTETDDLHLINMDQVVKVDVLRDVSEDSQSSPLEPDTFHVDISELQNRLKRNVETARQKLRQPGNSEKTTQ